MACDSLARDRKRSARLEFSGDARRIRPAKLSTNLSFHERGDTEEKNRQRSRVGQFIKEHFRKCGRRMILVSLPGERWSLENNLLCELGVDSRFIGLERDVRVFNRSLPFMPSVANRRQFRYRFAGVNKYVDVVESGIGIHVNVDAEWFFNPAFRPSNWRQPSTWGRKTRYNAIWLDSFSPLGTESYAHILRSVAKARSTVAAAFSFIIGRDDSKARQMLSLLDETHSALEQREAFIAATITAAGAMWIQRDSFQHNSFNDEGNVRIGTVCGIVEPVNFEHGGGI